MGYFVLSVVAVFLAWLIQRLQKESNILKEEIEDIKEFVNYDYKALAAHRESNRELRNTSLAHVDEKR